MSVNQTPKIKAKKWTLKKKADAEGPGEKQYFNEEDQSLEDMKKEIKKKTPDIDFSQYDEIDPVPEEVLDKDESSLEHRGSVRVEQSTSSADVAEDVLLTKLQMFYFASQARILDEASLMKVRTYLLDKLQTWVEKHVK